MEEEREREGTTVDDYLTKNNDFIRECTFRDLEEFED